jgi:MFS family permease
MELYHRQNNFLTPLFLFCKKKIKENVSERTLGGIDPIISFGIAINDIDYSHKKRKMRQEAKVQTSNLVAVAILMLANVAMSINQGNISASYLQIDQDFRQGIVGLGFLSSSFFLAYAVFEVPGGFLAAKFGPKKLICIGTAINAASVIASSFSPMFNDLLAFRFLAGLGFAFAYPCILVLIVRYYSVTKAGFGIGLMSLSSAVGSLLGLFGWAVFSDISGWRIATLVGGLIDVLALGTLMLMVPRDRMQFVTGFTLSHIKKIAFDKILGVMATANFGLAATSGLVSSFMIYYMESRFRTPPSLAGGVVALGFAIPIVSAPLTGRLYDSIQNRKALILSASLAESASVSASALGSFPAALLTSLTARPISSGTTIVAMSTARHRSFENPEFESASVAWVDSFSLYGNFVAPVYFSFIAASQGYSLAWLVGGVIAILFALPVLLLKKNSLESKAVNIEHANSKSDYG